MSDPKATKMTLEEAVEIDRAAQAEQRLAEWHGSFYPRSNEQIRARAIVDQAVKAHKAFEEWKDKPTVTPMGYPDSHPRARWIIESNKLRALERGESEVQP